MIAFIVGTTAELIKIAPVHHELTARGRRCEIWYTGQHVDELAETLADLRLPDPELWLVPRQGARNLVRPADVPRWGLALARTVLRRRRALQARLLADGTPPIVLVHGDTFTAPIGAVVGRLLGARVGHVEAGMRSGNLMHPFPEELNRRVAGRLVDLHFPPTAREARNLRRHRGAVVVTGANTVLDAMREAIEHPVPSDLDLPAEYGIATLHRFELVRNRDQLAAVLAALQRYSRTVPIVMFVGASERDRLREYGLMDLFDDDHFLLREKLSYVAFQPVLAGATFVVTDSGGLQEESAHLGIPCAVHRVHTERPDGEGRSMILTRFSIGALEEFLADHARYRQDSTLDAHRPSAVIADALEALSR